MPTSAVECTPRAGQVVSRYRIRGLLGEGGMGLVFRAEDLRLGRPVALKFLRTRGDEDGGGLARLEREARVASALNHPNICTIHDIDDIDGQPFLVMELLEGATLSEHLKGGPLPFAQVLELALQLADALSAAHAKGVVHRDFKPGNVFVTREGRAKIVDFGLARLEPPVSGLTTSVLGLQTALLDEADELKLTAGLVVGTLPYMAPEQARAAATDGRTDLFAFGAVLYEMATGRPAFGGTSAPEVLAAVCDHTPPPPSHVECALPRELDGVILKSLQKSPADRYQSADEMHASLLRLRGEARGHQRSVAGNTSIEVALRRMKSIAVMPVRALTTDAAGDMLADGTTDALIAGLGKLTGLRVVSLTSVMGYKGVSMRLPELAGELEVDGVVEGCLVVTGGRARVTARLFHAAHERCVWSRMYEGGRRDILALQSELAEALAQQVWVVTAPRRAAGRSRSRRTGCGRDRLASMSQSPDDRRRLPTDAGAA